MSLGIVTFKYFIPLRWIYLMKVFMTLWLYNVKSCNILVIKYIIIVWIYRREIGRYTLPLDLWCRYLLLL